jgi:hypothetical protein
MRPIVGDPRCETSASTANASEAKRAVCQFEPMKNEIAPFNAAKRKLNLTIHLAAVFWL